MESARELTDATDDIIDLFRKGIFLYKGNVFKIKEEESEENKLKKIKDDYNKFFKYIEDESMGINYDLFKDYFYSSVPSALAKNNYMRQKIKKNNALVELIKVRWSNLKDEIEKRSEDETLKNQTKY